MRHYREQLLACDFFNIETIWLKTLTVFFFIDIGTWQVYLAGITDPPNRPWITQQSRNQVWTIQEQEDEFCGLIRDNDKKFPNAFDAVFEFTTQWPQTLAPLLQLPNGQGKSPRCHRLTCL